MNGWAPWGRVSLAGIVIGSVAVLGLTGCGDDDGGAEVTVVLSEWIVEPDPAAVDAGTISFVADNQGGEEHELVIVRADDPAALPTDEDGAVDESGLAAGALIGEIEDVASQSDASADFDLEAGSYVLFCNITEEEDDGSIESHFAEGMVSTFEVR